MTKRSCAVLLASLVCVGHAQAAVVLYEPFNYSSGQGLAGVNGQAYTAGVNPNPAGSPVGQTAPNGNPWYSTGWTGIGTTYAQSNDAVTSSTDLTYSNLQHTVSGSVQLGGLGYSPRVAFTSFNNDTVNGSAVDVYYSMLVRIDDLSSTNAAGGLIAGFNNTRGSQAANPASVGAAVFAKASGAGFVFGALKQGVNGGVAFYDTTVRTIGETYLVVAKYTIRGTNNTGGATPTTDDTAQIWINPVSLGGAEPGGALVANNGVGDLPTNTGDTGNGGGSHVVQSLLLRQSGTVNTATNSAVTGLIIDEVRVGSTFADVTPVANAAVPEPAALLVWGAISAVVIGIRAWYSERSLFGSTL